VGYVATKLDQAQERLAAEHWKGAHKSLEDAFYNLPTAPSVPDSERLIDLLSQLAERADSRTAEKARELSPKAEQSLERWRQIDAEYAAAPPSPPRWHRDTGYDRALPTPR